MEEQPYLVTIEGPNWAMVVARHASEREACADLKRLVLSGRRNGSVRYRGNELATVVDFDIYGDGVAVIPVLRRFR